MPAAFTNRSTRGTIRTFFRSPLFDVIQFTALILVFGLLVLRSGATTGYNWQWYRIPQYLFTLDQSGFTAGPLLTGLGITVKISGISLLFSLAIGLTTAFFRLSRSFVARCLATIYLETSRNTPLLIQIFFIYFVLGPTLGFNRFFSAVLALSIFEGAYTSEIFRSGIQSVPQGQIEAARSLGLSTYYTYRHIVLPQAIRTILPPLTSQAISLVKDSALVSTIAIYDLTMQAQFLVAETYLTFEIWFTVAAIYLAMTLFLSVVVGFMEKRLKLP
ncbi:amino acid ABC transporter permease [Desulforhopalus singaporensis]|uniref:Putative glutamine transport system permease protein GlnP n=1 Tax=Desulforhopalus singaporensis TaxID=91360 RepID=A0A1H0Q705_9BACT|nr:amino acid ABC transporter permease [Desulforhopalus singaporensis]SDP13171.1 amino acid ABC transporter membrane protein 1, PAAT family [Desulforhopalus singaporensis]